MSRLNALNLTSSLRRRLVDFAAANNALSDLEAMAACRAIWEGPGPTGGLASDLWVEGSIPHLSSGKTLKDAVKENLFPKKFADHLYRRDVFSDEMKLHFHQWKALEKGAAHENPAIIISAGTGAGKTESFLLPLLGDLVGRPRSPGGGCRAIILYPMNALVNDQVDRLDNWLKGQKDVTLCHFTSETPEDSAKARRIPLYGPHRFRTRNQARGLEDAAGKPLGEANRPRGQVPDILITNYSMLEYMLCRPQDSVFFGRDLRAVVLDEAHLYTSTLAAEMTLLLRRLYDKCGLRAEDVCQYATSATIGSGTTEELQRQLRGFAATLFSKPETSVHPIVGRTAKSALPEARPPETACSPSELLARAVEVDTIEMTPAGQERLIECAESCSRLVPALELLIGSGTVAESLESCEDQPALLLLALRYSPMLQRLEALLREMKQQPLNDLSHSLWNEDSESAQEATVLLLSLSASARSSLGAAPLLPHRLHAMFRPPEGFSVCCNPACPDSDFPSLGKLYPGRQERCDTCDAICLALYRCEGCELALLGATKSNGRIRVPGTTPPTAFYTLVGKHTAVIDFEAGKEVGAQKPGLACFACHTECPNCGGASEQYFSMRSSTSLVLSILAETMLSELPPLATTNEATNENLPARGRRLLAFSDSRSEAAALGPRLRHQHELQLVRAAIVKLFSEDSGVDPEVIASFQEEIEELTAKLEAGKFPGTRHAEKEAERDRLAAQLHAVQKGGSVKSWAERLERRPEMAQLLDEDGGDFHEAAGWNQVAWERNAREVRKRAVILMGRQLFRLPKRSVPTVETIGWVEVVFPDLESLVAPAELVGTLSEPSIRKGLVGVWHEFLAALLDTVRMDSAVTLGSDEEDKRWQSEGLVPGKWITRRAFIGSMMENRRRVFVGNVLKRIGLEDPESFISPVLENVFDQLKSRAVRHHLGLRDAVGPDEFAWLEIKKKQDKQGDQDALRLIFPELALRRPPRLYQSTTTGHVWSRSVLGCAPDRGEDGTLVATTAEELDATAKIGRARRELAESSPVFENALWAEEHSAQLSPTEARRRQDLFKIGARNLLSATTTLELGIDIGGLSGTFLSNVPPGLANYLQRAGRVGRRADGSSIVVTCARTRPFDREVFKNIGRFLRKPLRRPLVLMDRHRIVARHFHAWLMNQFFTQIYGPDHWVGAMGAFGRMGTFMGQPFPPKIDGPSMPKSIRLDPEVLPPISQPPEWWKSHAGEGLVAHFRDWMDWVEARLPEFEPRLETLFRDTPLTTEGVRWPDILAEARRIFENGVERWEIDYSRQLESWGEAAKPGQANAIRYQLKVFYQTTVIEAMANTRFLPRYGFPIGVHTLKVFKVDDKGKAREEDQFRLSRPGLLALREYVPGSQLLVGGKLVTSRGLSKHWTGANLDEALGLRGGAATCRNQHFFYWLGKPSNCPQCDEKPQNFMPLLFPSHGFTTAAWDPPRRSSDIERVGKVSTGTVAFTAHRSTDNSTEALGGVPRLMATYQEEGEMVVFNRGEHETGFAICTKCGYTESETKDPKPDLPRNFDKHLPLLQEKGAPCWRAHESPVLRHQSLAAREPTDMLLLDFSGFLGPDAKNRELIVSLAIAFRLSGARVLSLDSRELGEMIVRIGDAWGAVIYDNVPGGAGHVLELMNRGREWLENARTLLYVDEAHHQRCLTACLDCVLTFDAQTYFSDPDTPLDRRAALDCVDRMLAARSTVGDDTEETSRAESSMDYSGLEDLVDPTCLDLLELCRNAGRPRPTVGFPLMQEHRVGAQAELAWEDERIAVVTEPDDIEPFQTHGWRAMSPEVFRKELADPTTDLTRKHDSRAKVT